MLFLFILQFHVLTDLQNPRSSRFGSLSGGFSSVTSRIEVQLGASPVCRVEPSLSQTVEDCIKKIWTFIVFCKLLLDHVKVEILLILCLFLVFFGCPSLLHIHLQPHFLVYGRYSGGFYLGQVSFMPHLQFPSFQISNIFLPAESTISGYSWVVLFR